MCWPCTTLICRRHRKKNGGRAFCDGVPSGAVRPAAALPGAEGRKKRSDPLAEAARAAKITGKEFDSLGEYEYYIGTVAPKVARGEIVEWEAHPCFPLFPAGQYGALKLRPVRYTADFRLVYADGTVEIVEIKSKFVRRMQRDYALRRRVFLEQVARPAGWKFMEIITADSKEEIDRWTELTKGAK